MGTKQVRRLRLEAVGSLSSIGYHISARESDGRGYEIPLDTGDIKWLARALTEELARREAQEAEARS